MDILNSCTLLVWGLTDDLSPIKRGLKEGDTLV